jgi:periplasmic protein TonB
MNETIYADLDEIVFEGREKQYGAYDMRKKYNRYLERAALIAMIIFLFATAFPKVLKWVLPAGGDDENNIDMMTPVNLANITPPSLEDVPEPPKIDIPPPVKATIEFKVPKPAPEDQVKDEETIKEMEEIEKTDAQIGLEDVKGTNTDYDFGDLDGNSLNEEVVVKEVEKEVGPNEFVNLEKEPTPVNLDQLKGLIGYPPMAKEAEIEGKVIVRVQVDKTGHYVKHIVIKDPHPILTKAVTDKISQLSFTPGIQAGKPIKVWVTIPFDFKLLK